MKKEQQPYNPEPELTSKVVEVKRVVKVVKGGRQLRFTALVVVGDGKGQVGYALGKAKSVVDAMQKGETRAKRNMINISLRRETIPHEVKLSQKGALIFLLPAAPGTGIIAGGAMRVLLEAAGVKNVLAKSKGSSNRHNIVAATFTALENMEDALAVAQRRGVSLNTVFNG
jgi:small subunit ribosomal protein S5